MTSSVNQKKNDKFRPVLLMQALVRYVLSLVFIGLLIFIPAGSFSFMNGWLFLGTLFIPMLFVMAYLLLYDPELLEKRFKTKEKEKTQKIYLVVSIVFCFIIFMIPGFDHRFGWSHLPLWLVILCTVVMLSSYYMFFLCMRQNTFASRVVEIQDRQKRIDTGLYGRIRHPMYTSGSILFMSAPLVMGSVYGFLVSFLIPVLLIIRLKNEEKVLVNGLEGYKVYMEKVKYRLIPFIW